MWSIDDDMRCIQQADLEFAQDSLELPRLPDFFGSWMRVRIPENFVGGPAHPANAKTKVKGSMGTLATQFFGDSVQARLAGFIA
jgi:hypothetical protein